MLLQDPLVTPKRVEDDGDMRRETHVFAGTMKLDGSVTDTTEKVEPVDTAAEVDCETPSTVIVVVDVGASPELGTRLKVIVGVPLTHKAIEVIL